MHMCVVFRQHPKPDFLLKRTQQHVFEIITDVCSYIPPPWIFETFQFVVDCYSVYFLRTQVPWHQRSTPSRDGVGFEGPRQVLNDNPRQGASHKFACWAVYYSNTCFSVVLIYRASLCSFLFLASLLQNSVISHETLIKKSGLLGWG